MVPGTRITSDEARSRLGKFKHRAISGEVLIITDHGNEVAAMMGLPRYQQLLDAEAAMLEQTAGVR